MSRNISIDEDVLFEHVHAHALEYPHSLEDHVDDDVEWSLRGVSCTGTTEIETDGGLYAIVFHGGTAGTAQRKVHRATRTNPADYETIDVEIAVEITWIPEASNGMGTIEVEALQDTQIR